MADIREDGSEVFHFDIPDYPISIKKNFIPRNCDFGDLSIHWHEEIEITYVIAGSIKHQLNGKKVTINAGEAIFINSKQLHLIESNDEDCVLYCLIFHPTILCSSNYIAKKYISPIVDNEKLDYFYLKESDASHKPILDAIKRIKQLEDDGENELIMMTTLYDLWRNLHEVLPKAKTCEKLVNEDLRTVQKMMLKVHNQYADNINLEDICNAGNIGKTKGTKLFFEYINMTPVDYLINYRLEIAAGLLRDSKLSVIDIALEAGFSDSSYFARVFKKRVGMSPLAYRKQENQREKD